MHRSKQYEDKGADSTMNRRFSIAATTAAERSDKLGSLPEWNLGDLYSSPEAPEVAFDLASAEAECVAFEETYKGKLGDIAAASDAGGQLHAAVVRFEAVEELLG
jgi:oligoendopeptidase F